VLTRIALVTAAVALGVTVAGAHQGYKADHGELNLAVAERLLSTYQGSAGGMPAVFPNGATNSQDADSVKVAWPRMGRCRACHEEL
jgi:hypothetical protein